MPHSYSRIWVHSIWSTKNRRPLILPGIEQTVYDFMRVELFQYECHPKIINGMPDHVHALDLCAGRED